MPAPSAAQPPRAPRTTGRAAFQRWRRARPGVGNWFRLEYPEPAEDPLAREELNKERVRLLLDRYGILFRELLTRELPMLRWPALFRALRLMELSGEVLCGHFFEGIEGLQFISPPALESLAATLPADAVFWLSGIDPASLCGLGLASLRGSLPRRLPGVHLVYHGTHPVLFSHSLGARLDILVPADHPRLRDYFGFLDHLLTRRNLVAALEFVSITTFAPAPVNPASHLATDRPRIAARFCFSIQTPDGKIENGGEGDPDGVGYEQICGVAIDPVKKRHHPKDHAPQNDDFDECQAGVAHPEKEHRPQDIEKQLHPVKDEGAAGGPGGVPALPYSQGSDPHEGVKGCPGRPEDPSRWGKIRFNQIRIPGWNPGRREQRSDQAGGLGNEYGDDETYDSH
jgi:hypothetical protein